MFQISRKHKKRDIDGTPLTINYLPFTNNAQVMLEFTFCMIVILIMIFGVTKVFHWTGNDPAQRRISHDLVLTNQAASSLEQIDPYFYQPIGMNAVWDGFE